MPWSKSAGPGRPSLASGYSTTTVRVFSEPPAHASEPMNGTSTRTAKTPHHLRRERLPALPGDFMAWAPGRIDLLGLPVPADRAPPGKALVFYFHGIRWRARCVSDRSDSTITSIDRPSEQHFAHVASRLGLRLRIRVTLAGANDPERPQAIRVADLPIDLAIARNAAQAVEQTLHLISAGPLPRATGCCVGRLG